MAFEKKAHFLSFYPENNFEQILAKCKRVQKKKQSNKSLKFQYSSFEK